MRWQTWTRFTAIILFVITVLTFAFTYSDNFVEGSSNIEFQNFPTATDLDSLDLNEDIEFSSLTPAQRKRTPPHHQQ